MGARDNYLYAINPNGTLKWRFLTGWYVQSSPAVGSDGTIYVGSDDGYLYAINPDGSLKWMFRTDSSITSSATVGPDGIIYIGSVDGYLYAVYSSSLGLANSSWPKFRRNLKNTGNVRQWKTGLRAEMDTRN